MGSISLSAAQPSSPWEDHRVWRRASRSSSFLLCSFGRSHPFFHRPQAPLCPSTLSGPPAYCVWRRASVSSAGLASGSKSTADPALPAFDALLRWCIETQGLHPPAIEPALVDDELLGDQRPGLVATCDTKLGDVLLQIPGDIAMTVVDVQKDPLLEQLAENRSELVSLALLLLKERANPSASAWAPLLATLPHAVDTPIMWPDDEREALLRGSPTLRESKARQAALESEWSSIAGAIAEMGGEGAYPAAVFNAEGFKTAMSVVVAQAAYLPAAQCFALLPLVGCIARTGSAAGAVLDYDLDRQAVTLVAARPYASGEEVKLYDGRPNGEILLATGTVEPSNPADCLGVRASLVAADRLYQLKRQVVEEYGFNADTEFPVFEDRLATQHLAFLRLARLTDAAQLAKVSFEQDVVITPENEYEILQLLMADLRDMMQSYENNYEEDIKMLQRKDLTRRERVAAALRVAEKRIIRGTMGGVRRRLAPIRGIPTKAGRLEDPNADLAEVFETIESLPQAPRRLWEGLSSWARGDDDPDWKQKR